MEMPKEVLDQVAKDIEKADQSLADLKDVVSDMRLSGMDTAKQDDQIESLTAKLRALKLFYERRKAKQ